MYLLSTHRGNTETGMVYVTGRNPNTDSHVLYRVNPVHHNMTLIASVRLRICVRRIGPHRSRAFRLAIPSSLRFLVASLSSILSTVLSGFSS